MLTRLSKKLYYHNYFETNLHNMKKTWEGINNLINRNKKGNKSINTLKRPNNKGLSQKPSEISNILNNHFASIGHKLASNMPNTSVPFTDYLPTTNMPGSFVFDPTSPSEIELEIMQTPLNKAYGLCSCPTRILRCAGHIISQPLSNIINNSVSQGIYPSKLKHAKVIPIYKGEDDTDPGNYRPISLLSIFNGIFEKIMYNWLKQFFDKYVLYKSQYGNCNFCRHSHERKKALPTGKPAPNVARKITLIQNAMRKRLDKRLPWARSTTQRRKSML